MFVSDPPRIIASQTSNDMTIQEKEYQTLECNATGRPTPTLQWRREGDDILPGGGVVSYVSVTMATRPCGTEPF